MRNKTLSEFTADEKAKLKSWMRPATKTKFDETKEMFQKWSEHQVTDEEVKGALEARGKGAYMDLYSCDTCTSTLTNDGHNLWCDYHKCSARGVILEEKLDD